MTTKSQTLANGPRKIKRLSSLKSPTMLLTGHTADVYSCAFSPDASVLASSSMDQSILLWRPEGECENYGKLSGHTKAVLHVQWGKDSETLASCSADASVCLWDVKTGERLKKFTGHQAIVNSISTCKRGPDMVASASDDGTVKVWDFRQKIASKTYESAYPITSVAFSVDGSLLFSAGIDTSIRCTDLRTDAVIFELDGHCDTVTGLKISPKGTHLLSNAMDNTVKIWDVKPFSITPSRELKSFEGKIYLI